MNFQSVLDFWFEDSRASYDAFLSKRETWFTACEAFDNEIAERFTHYLEPAADGQLSIWENSEQSILALIIVLDQFPRNIYRGTEQAFAYDKHALRVARKVIDSRIDNSLTLLERMFAYMPLQHSEELDVQELSVKMFGKLVDDSDGTPFHAEMADSIQYAQLHHEIIERFGRFPHRNEILGRKSTEEELAYLASGAETFGQVKK